MHRRPTAARLANQHQSSVTVRPFSEPDVGCPAVQRRFHFQAQVEDSDLALAHLQAATMEGTEPYWESENTTA